MKSAVIGYGVIGRVHSRVLYENGGNFAVCDISEKALAEARRDYTGINTYADYIEMFDEFKPDVVHICTPHFLHARMAVDALGRNINVLCEKPMCMRKEEIYTLLEAEKKSSAQLGVCFQNRYNPANIFVKDFLKGQKVISASANVIWRRDAEYYSDDWHGKADKEGGGVLINQALHTIDLMQWFLGMPDSVCASCANVSLKGRTEVEDTAWFGCFGTTDFSLMATVAGKDNFPAEIMISTEDHELNVYPEHVVLDGRTIRFDDKRPKYGKTCYGSGHIALISDFYDCVEKGRKFGIDGEEGAKAVRITLSAYESRGRKIKIFSGTGE